MKIWNQNKYTLKVLNVSGGNKNYARRHVSLRPKMFKILFMIVSFYSELFFAAKTLIYSHDLAFFSSHLIFLRMPSCNDVHCTENFTLAKQSNVGFLFIAIKLFFGDWTFLVVGLETSRHIITFGLCMLNVQHKWILNIFDTINKLCMHLQGLSEQHVISCNSPCKLCVSELFSFIPLLSCRESTK